MTRAPFILITPSIETKGVEFGDMSVSLAETYQWALEMAGGLPMILPTTVSRSLIADAVSRCDGVLLTGGDDVEPSLYGDGVAPKLRKTVCVTPDGGKRDFRELTLIDEVFRQRKPLLAICRGHQILNVALGGTLVADIRTQLKGAMNHRQMARKSEVVHDVRLTRGSLLSMITGRQTLGVNSTHHQAIGRVAGPLRVAAASDDGVIESLELKPRAARMLPFLLSVQFHPERLANRLTEHAAIFRAFTHACKHGRKNML